MLERVFQIRARGSSLSVELLGGVTLFMGNVTNLIATSSVLAAGGLPLADGVMGGAWAGFIGQVFVGLLSNLPIAVSAGAGPNLTVAYLLAQSVSKGGLGSYDAALTVCFASGLVIVALTACGAISVVTDLVPTSLKMGICAGIGLLCAFVGFQQVGMVVRSDEGLIGPGDFMNSPEIWLSLGGFLFLTLLVTGKVKGAILITTLLLTAVDWTFVTSWPDFELTPLSFPKWFLPDQSMSGVPAFWMQVFAMTMMLVFDAMGCIFGMAKLAGRMDEATGAIEGGNGMFYAIGLGTSACALCGVSPLVVSGPSSAAITEGARTGLSTCVSGVLMLAVGAPLSSILAKMPPCTSSFVLIYTGVSMFSDTAHISWEDPIAAVPAFLCIISQPFLFSIADGIYMGLVSSFILNLLTGRMFKQAPARRKMSVTEQLLSTPKGPRASAVMSGGDMVQRAMSYAGASDSETELRTPLVRPLISHSEAL